MSWEELMLYLQNLQPYQRRQRVRILENGELYALDVAEMGVSRIVCLVPLFEVDEDASPVDASEAT